MGDRGIEIPLGADGVTGERVVSVAANTNGRSGFWSEVIATLKTPWDYIFGKGVGLGSEYGKELYPCCFPTPLNEYIRVLVDNGIIGLLVTGGLVILIWGRLYRSRQRNEAAVGLLALVSELLLALTESPFIYPFYLFPLTLLIGLGLGTATLTPPLSEVRNLRFQKNRHIAEA